MKPSGRGTAVKMVVIVIIIESRKNNSNISLKGERFFRAESLDDKALS